MAQVNEKQFKEYVKSKHAEAKAIIEKAAKEASDEIADFFQEEIDTFYREYDPILYVRHHDRGLPERGLDKTYTKVFKETSKGDVVRFTGGINVNTRNMYSDYSGTQEQVLYSFLAGYHGLPPFLEPRQNATQKSIAPITAAQYGSGVHPLKDTRNFMRYVLEPKLRKSAKFKE